MSEQLTTKRFRVMFWSSVNAFLVIDDQPSPEEIGKGYSIVVKVCATQEQADAAARTLNEEDGL